MLESTQYATIKLLSFIQSFYGVPRFGQSKDVSYFLSDDGILRNDYMIGLIFVFSMIMGAALLWFLILLFLRLLGARVGCGSGNAATIPAESMMSKGSYSVHTDETGEFIVMQADQNRVNRTRIVYFISGLYTAVACGFLAWGCVMLMRSLTSFHDSAESLHNNVDSTRIDSLFTTAAEFDTLRDDLVLVLTGFCAGAATEVNGFNPATVAENLRLSLSAVDDISTDATWATLRSDVSDLDTMLEKLVNFLKMVDGPATLWFILAISIVSTLFVLCIYMLSMAWKSGKEGYQFVGEDRPNCGSRFHHFLATPIFALLLASLWFATSTIFTSQIANADFCYDEILTGEMVNKMLVERGYADTSDAYLLVDEYLHGCENKTATPNAQFNSFESKIDDAFSKSNDFQALTPDGDSTQLEAVCGPSTTVVLEKSDALNTNLNTIKTDFDSIYSSMTCETMAPIIQKAVYENSCNSLSQGLLWSFIAGLCGAVFGTIMLSLRSATVRPQIYIVTPNPAASRSGLDSDSFS